MATVLAAARATAGTVVLNPAPPRPLSAEVLAEVDVLVPNEHELARLTGVAPSTRSPAEVAALARRLTSATRSLVVTLGARGALLVPGDGTPALHQPALPVEPVDTTGAGDCFCGALSTALSRGSSLAEAVRYAVTAAALSTTGAGARSALPEDADVQTALRRLPAAQLLPGPAAQPVASSTATSA
jgi:ribokinase